MNATTGRRTADRFVCWWGDSDVVEFAARELHDYLSRMVPERVNLLHLGDDGVAPERSIILGTADLLDHVAIPVVPDPVLDDAIAIEVHDGIGWIGGANPRSVLLGVYRYLTELGCRWIRPGDDGELIPSVDLAGTAVRLSERPSYRHRVIDFDGALGFEHIRDAIAWAPKLGFNGYFLELRCGHYAFDAWYQPDRKPGHPGVLSYAQSEDIWRRLSVEINRRGLARHAEGHWTYEPLGVHWLTYDVQPPELPSDLRDLLAMIDGERRWVLDNPLFTQLCYSNPAARRLLIEDVVAYAQAHPDVTVLHVWLADIPNNYCECPECRQRRPADWYVQVLNELDARLTAEGLGTRIGFAVYMDLLWPPLEETFRNPDRFVLMFAPITRTYARPFSADAPLPEMRPYDFDHVRLPATLERNDAHLRAWQALFGGDSFTMEYHLWRPLFTDPTGLRVARVLHDDIRELAPRGLNGMNVATSQRSWTPSGLCMTMLGRTLWDRDVSCDEVVSEVFRSTFGEDGDACRERLETLADAFEPVRLAGGRIGTDAAVARSIARVPALVAGMKPLVARNVDSGPDIRRASWRYLALYLDIVAALARALEARAAGDPAEAMARLDAAVVVAREREPLMHRVFDVHMFEAAWRALLGRRTGERRHDDLVMVDWS
jgi:hypothetical protein